MSKSPLRRLSRGLALAGMRPPLTQQLLLYRPDRTMVDGAGKRVVLTGASSGIGEAAAEKFARRGARLVVVARRQELLDAVVDRITAAGGDALALACWRSIAISDGIRKATGELEPTRFRQRNRLVTITTETTAQRGTSGRRTSAKVTFNAWVMTKLAASRSSAFVNPTDPRLAAPPRHARSRSNPVTPTRGRSLWAGRRRRRLSPSCSST